MSLTAPSASPTPSLTLIDVWLVLFAAPVLLLIGVPAAGYLIGAGAWIALRAVGIAVDRRIAAIDDIRQEVKVRLFYVMGRVVLLALAVIVARKAGGRDDGLTALIVVAFAFTVQFAIAFANRPRPSR